MNRHASKAEIQKTAVQRCTVLVLWTASTVLVSIDHLSMSWVVQLGEHTLKFTQQKCPTHFSNHMPSLSNAWIATSRQQRGRSSGTWQPVPGTSSKLHHTVLRSLVSDWRAGLALLRTRLQTQEVLFQFKPAKAGFCFLGLNRGG